MTYGAEIRNAAGDLVADFSMTLYAARSGNTMAFADVVADADALADANGLPSGGSRATILGTAVLSQVAETLPYAAVHNTKTFIGPQFRLELGDMVFYQIGTTGIQQQGHVFCDLPGGYPSNKGLGLVYPVGGVSLPFIVASMVAATGSGSYGMQLMDATGAVTFDSRKPLFSVFHEFLLTKAACDGVINTGTPVVYTLPKAQSNAYVSAPSMLGYKEYQNGSNAYRAGLVLKQTSSTQLTLSRVTAGSDTSGLFKMWTQDTPVFVGRPV